MVLANQLRRYQKLSLSDSLKYAWMVVKAESDAILLTFKTTAQKVCKRLVSSDLKKYWTPTGNGRKPKEGLSLFVDLAKFEVGLPCIISTYEILSVN